MRSGADYKASRSAVHKFDPIGRAIGVHKVQKTIEDKMIDKIAPQKNDTPVQETQPQVAESGIDRSDETTVATTTKKKKNTNVIRQGVASTFHKIEEL